MYKIQIDNFIFHVNVTEYSPAIPGSYSYDADSDMDYYGIPLEFDWECDTVTELFEGLTSAQSATYRGEIACEIVDAYAEQITCKLLDKLKFEQECAEEYYV